MPFLGVRREGRYVEACARERKQPARQSGDPVGLPRLRDERRLIGRGVDSPTTSKGRGQVPRKKDKFYLPVRECPAQCDDPAIEGVPVSATSSRTGCVTSSTTTGASAAATAWSACPYYARRSTGRCPACRPSAGPEAGSSRPTGRTRRASWRSALLPLTAPEKGRLPGVLEACRRGRASLGNLERPGAGGIRNHRDQARVRPRNAAAVLLLQLTGATHGVRPLPVPEGCSRAWYNYYLWVAFLLRVHSAASPTPMSSRATAGGWSIGLP